MDQSFLKGGMKKGTFESRNWLRQLMKSQFFMIFGLCWLLTGCGLLDDATLEIHMMGIYEIPEGAQGDETPQYQNYTMLGYSVLIDGEPIEADQDWEEKDLRIIDRPQRVLKLEIEDFAGQMLSNVIVQFEPTVVGGNKNHGPLSVNLNNPVVQLAEPFELERGRSYVLLLHVRWRQTIADGDMAAPELILVRK